MASAENATPTCPVCHQADQVKTTEAAYNSGVTSCAPPDMPTRQVSMMAYVTACIFLVGICVFCIIVFIGGSEGGVPVVAQVVLLGITILSILTALGVSYYAFQRVVRGDAETTQLLPEWDEAMKTWRNLYYCSRDDVVFNPTDDKVVTSEQLTSLRSFSQRKGEMRSALASHS